MKNETLESRIKILENQLANLQNWVRKVAVFGVCTAISGWALLFTTTCSRQQDVVQANRFEVMKDGQPVAILSSNDFGGMLNIANIQRKSVAIIGASSNGAALGISMKDGIPTVQIFNSAHGGGINVFNKEGKIVGVFYAKPEGGTLGLNKTSGGLAFRAP